MYSAGFPPIEPILITSFVAAAAVGASGWLVQAAEGERPVDSYPIEIRPMLLFIQRLFQGFRDRRWVVGASYCSEQCVVICMPHPHQPKSKRFAQPVR